MSVFSGAQHKGSGRAHRRLRMEQAYARAMAIWNDGTGMIAMPNGTWKPVADPKVFLKKNDPRRTDGRT